MKKTNKKKGINYFRVFLFFLLLISTSLYVKLYVIADEVTVVDDLPSSVTNTTWYEYNSLSTLKFSSGTVDSDDSKFLSTCNRYSYNKNNKIISFNCNGYSMKLVSVTKYKMIVVLSGLDINSTVFIYYNSLELINYLKDNNIDNISDEDIDFIMNEKSFDIEKDPDNIKYKSAQLSKLSSIDELSIDEYYLLKNDINNSIILLINENMSIDSYDLIPIFIDWKNTYTEYDFYYINGSGLSGADYDLLNRDEDLRKYLIGLDDNNILIFNNGNYKRVSVEIDIEKENEVIFNCFDDCSEIELNIFDDENNYSSIDEILRED